jgi:hypothetical protein
VGGGVDGAHSWHARWGRGRGRPKLRWFGSRVTTPSPPALPPAGHCSRSRRGGPPPLHATGSPRPPEPRPALKALRLRPGTRLQIVVPALAVVDHLLNYVGAVVEQDDDGAGAPAQHGRHLLRGQTEVGWARAGEAPFFRQSRPPCTCRLGRAPLGPPQPPRLTPDPPPHLRRHLEAAVADHGQRPPPSPRHPPTPPPPPAPSSGSCRRQSWPARGRRPSAPQATGPGVRWGWGSGWGLGWGLGWGREQAGVGIEAERRAAAGAGPAPARPGAPLLPAPALLPAPPARHPCRHPSRHPLRHPASPACSRPTSQWSRSASGSEGMGAGCGSGLKIGQVFEFEAWGWKGASMRRSASGSEGGRGRGGEGGCGVMGRCGGGRAQCRGERAQSPKGRRWGQGRPQEPQGATLAGVWSQAVPRRAPRGRAAAPPAAPPQAGHYSSSCSPRRGPGF